MSHRMSSPNIVDVVYCFVHEFEASFNWGPIENQLRHHKILGKYVYNAHLIAARQQVMGSGSPVSTVMGTFIATTLLYTMILLVSICALIYWNKKHR